MLSHPARALLSPGCCSLPSWMIAAYKLAMHDAAPLGIVAPVQEGAGALAGVRTNIRIEEVVVIDVVATKHRQSIGKSVATSKWDRYGEFTAVTVGTRQRGHD